MTVRNSLCYISAALCTVAAATSGAALAQYQRLSMLDRLEQGDWELRSHDEPGEPRRLCLNDARRLIQLRHPGQNCRRVVVQDVQDEVTVQYTCPGRGYGRTHIRREAGNLIQIDSQGIAQGVPFAFSAEARRVGACGA